MAQVCNPSALDVEEAEVEARKIKKNSRTFSASSRTDWVASGPESQYTNKGWSLSKVGHVVFVK